MELDCAHEILDGIVQDFLLLHRKEILALNEENLDSLEEMFRKSFVKGILNVDC